MAANQPLFGVQFKANNFWKRTRPLLEKEIEKSKKQLEVQVTNRPLLLENKIKVGSKKEFRVW